MNANAKTNTYTNTNNVINNMISFYIPRISTKYSEEDVINTFYLVYIGVVKRVDFTPITPKKTNDLNINVNTNTKFQSAFVHMNFMYNSIFANEVYNTTYVNNRSFKFNANPNDSHEFWLILKNLNPIPETNLNIHQVVENARLLEEKVLNQEKLIEEQQKTIELQTGQIERIQETINQLTGICFGHEKQMNQQKEKVTYRNFNYLVDYMLYGVLDYVEEEHDEEDKEDHQDNDSVITYTNMPELISLDSEDSRYEEEEEEEEEEGEEKEGSNSDDSAKERMRFTNVCCDNF